MSYKFPIERPLPVNVFDICDGPFIMGSTQVQQYTDRWAVWVASETIRLGKFTTGMVLDDSAGQADDLFVDFGAEISPGGNYFGFGIDLLSLVVGQRYVLFRGANEAFIGQNGVFFPVGSSEFVAGGDGLISCAPAGSGVARTYSIKTKGFRRPSKISLCFEQAALPVIAVQKDATTIEIRRKVSSVVTAYVFTGNSPVLFYNGVSIIDTSVTDAVCLYIKPAGDKIFARFQRDNFGIEYTVNATLAPGAVIQELRKTDRRNIGGVNYQTLWGLAADGRQLYFRTAAYPPLPQYPVDKLTDDVSLSSGAHGLIVFPNNAPTDKVLTDGTFFSGVFLAVVIYSPTATDKITEDTTFTSGSYPLVVITAAAPTDKLTEDTTLNSGAYDLRIIPTNSPTDKVTIDTALSSGTYS